MPSAPQSLKILLYTLVHSQRNRFESGNWEQMQGEEGDPPLSPTVIG